MLGFELKQFGCRSHTLDHKALFSPFFIFYFSREYLAQTESQRSHFEKGISRIKIPGVAGMCPSSGHILVPLNDRVETKKHRAIIRHFSTHPSLILFPRVPNNDSWTFG